MTRYKVMKSVSGDNECPAEDTLQTEEPAGGAGGPGEV